MKKLLIASAFLFSAGAGKAQYSTDSLHRNEIGVSILPVVTLFSGAFDGGPMLNMNLSYKYHLKNNSVVRSALVWFPAIGYARGDGETKFDHSRDTVNVFRVHYSDAQRIQLNLGIEKLFRVRYMTHGFGIDLFANRQNRYEQTNFWWEPKSAQSDPNVIMYNNMQRMDVFKVDSLSSSASSVTNGCGFHLFYSARLRMGNRLYLTSSFGPYLNLGFTRYRWGSGKMSNIKGQRTSSVDVNLLLADISLSYRF